MTYLQKISYKQNQSKYQDYIIGELPNSSYVEFDYGVCVGGKNNGEEETKKECQKGGGQWVNYEPGKLDGKYLDHDYYYNSNKTKVKIDYLSDNEISLDEINNKDLYRDKCNKPIPVKPLPHMTGEIDLGLNTELNNVVNHPRNNNINHSINNISKNSIHNNSVNNTINNVEPKETQIVEGFNVNSTYCNVALISFILLVLLIQMNRK